MNEKKTSSTQEKQRRSFDIFNVKRGPPKRWKNTSIKIHCVKIISMFLCFKHSIKNTEHSMCQFASDPLYHILSKCFKQHNFESNTFMWLIHHLSIKWLSDTLKKDISAKSSAVAWCHASNKAYTFYWWYDRREVRS